MNKGEQHPAFQANKWKPGQSGNPAGRPPRKSLETIALDILEEKIKQDPLPDGTTPDPMTKLEALARIMVDEALANRNFKVINVLIQRLWPVLTKHEIGGQDGGPITVAELIRQAKDEE